MKDEEMKRSLLDEERTISRTSDALHSYNFTMSPYWNILLLALAWALTLTTSTLLTTIGPLSAKNLGASDSIAAFTIGSFLIGAALSSVPSSWIFRIYGRLIGFSLGCVAQITGSCMGAISIASESLFLLYAGCFFVGLGQGLGQFYRFSAVEVSPDRLKTRAVTYVLSGGILAAFLGPTSAQVTANVIGKQYMGSFLTIGLVGVINQVVITLVNFPPVKKAEVKTETIAVIDYQRSVREIVFQQKFVIACAVATLAHSIMIMLMSNVTLSMKGNDYSLAICSLVMELHFFSMFAPGFFTGRAIERYGTMIVAFTGGLIFAGSAIVLAVGIELWNYILGMSLLGIAWNLSFSAGTVMLTTTYKPAEATKVQAINDFILFSVAGGGSLASGYIFELLGMILSTACSAYTFTITPPLGWLTLIFIVCGMMIVYILLFLAGWCSEQPGDGESVFEEGRVLSQHSSRQPSLDDREPSFFENSTTGSIREERFYSDFVNNIRSNSFASASEARISKDNFHTMRSFSGV